MRSLKVIIVGLLLVSAPAQAEWALAIHGGVNDSRRADTPAEEVTAHREGLARALAAGSAVLAGGGNALDAVEAAVRVLEDDPNFNAGRGAVFSHEGRNELDAAIMEGTGRKAGAVAGVTRTQNPISLARAVMEKSQHVMLARDGADQFAIEQGLPQVDPAYFATDAARESLEKAKRKGGFDGRHMGTVGAVARDSRGHIAAATSTGGITNKRWGRIGDSPIIGAGTYADDRGCAVSATGSGEYFIRIGVAHEICARVRLTGEAIAKAASDVVRGEVKAMGGAGGVIVMGKAGPGDWAFTTPIMSRARITEGGEADIRIFADE